MSLLAATSTATIVAAVSAAAAVGTLLVFLRIAHRTDIDAAREEALALAEIRRQVIADLERRLASLERRHRRAAQGREPNCDRHYWGHAPRIWSVASERRRVPAEIRNVTFPVSVRGYDRRAVDAYVIRANRLIAELEATRSPESAVQRALERAEDQRSGMLEEARAAAAQTVAAAQREADEIIAKARAEAADVVVYAGDEADRTRAEADEYVAKSRAAAEEILAESREKAAEELRRAQEEIAASREEAEAWVRKLRADTDAVWAERGDLLGDLRDVAARLHEAVSQTAGR
jgi:DivIVA domain-containing protein